MDQLVYITARPGPDGTTLITAGMDLVTRADPTAVVTLTPADRAELLAVLNAQSGSDLAAIREHAAAALEGCHEDTIGTDEEHLDGLARDLAGDVLTLLGKIVRR